MFNLYNDKEFSAVSEFVLWIEDSYIELMDNFEISTFILDLVGIVTVQGKGFDELIDAAIYPEWKDIHPAGIVQIQQFPYRQSGIPGRLPVYPRLLCRY